MELIRLSVCILHLLGLLNIHQVVGVGIIEVTNLPNDVTLDEADAAGTFVFSVVYMATPGVTGTVSCTSAHSDFSAADTSNGADISIASGVVLDAASSPVDVVITCSESGTTASGSGTLTVTIIDNAAPQFDNGVDFGSVTVSARTTKSGHVVMKLGYSDSDSTLPLPSQTIDSGDTYNIFNLSGDFITITDDLINYDDVASYTLTITVDDGFNTLQGTATINLDERNTWPEFVFSSAVLEDTISYPEFTEGRLLVYTIDAIDKEHDSITFTDVGRDTNVSTYFDLIPTTGEIYLLAGQMFDYEAVTQFTFMVTIEDYLEPNPTSTFTLVINVNDMNEQPVFSGTPSGISVNESDSATVVGTPDHLCTDPDNTNPNYTILLGPQSSYFSIDIYSAEISFAKATGFDYDDVNLDKEVNLTIRCFDDRGLYDDQVVTITVLDINDNNPVCSPGTSDFKLKYDQVVNETIVNVDCSDKDSNENAELDYEIVGLNSGYGKTYFQADVYGNVSIYKDFAMDYNTSFYVTVLVTDRGTPSLSATVTLTVTYTEKPLVIVYEEVTEVYPYTTSALTLISAASLAGAMLITCGIVLTVLRCCYDRERRDIVRTLTKTKKKKSSWRWCGCLRPGERKTVKKPKKEIVLAENRDQEYMRARNALLGIEEEPTAGPSLTPAGQPLSKTRRHGKMSIPSGAGAAQNITFLGRDKTPDISATPVDKMGLTPSQKVQLQKFEEMKRTADGPSTSKKGQAAGNMVWAFDGR